jgi:hypothetical protein
MVESGWVLLDERKEKVSGHEQRPAGALEPWNCAMLWLAAAITGYEPSGGPSRQHKSTSSTKKAPMAWQLPVISRAQYRRTWYEAEHRIKHSPTQESIDQPAIRLTVVCHQVYLFGSG